MEAESRGTSPWIFIGVGCLLSIFAVVAVVVAIGAWGFSQVRELQRTMEDPGARTELAAEMLATDEIPEGYNAVVALSIPFLMETVVLSDKEPDENGRIVGFGERGFIFFKALSIGEQEQELRDFFEGRTEDSELLEQTTSVRVNAEEFVGRGVIEEDERTLRWVSYRGEISSPGSNQFGEGLTSMVMFECPGKDRVRMGIWFGPDPDPETPAESASLAGSVADEAEIQRFMRPFDVCSR
jgi:hypothetical protein